MTFLKFSTLHYMVVEKTGIFSLSILNIYYKKQLKADSNAFTLV